MSQRRKLTKAEKFLFSTVAVLGLLLLAVPLFWRNLSTTPVINIPNPALPEPNAYDLYMRAGSSIINNAEIGHALSPPLNQAKQLTPKSSIKNQTENPAARTYTYDEKAALVQENQEALALMREGFRYQCMQPPVRSFTAALPSGNLRYLTRLVALEAQVKASAGDWYGSVASSLDGIELGNDAVRGGQLIGGLVGYACEAIARKDVRERIKHLTAAQARAAAQRLEAIEATRVPFAQVMEEEKWSGLASMMQILKTPGIRNHIAALGMGAPTDWRNIPRLLWRGKRGAIEDYTKFMDTCIAKAKLPYPQQGQSPLPQTIITQTLVPVYDKARFPAARSSTMNAMLITHLALHAYRLEHGRYPKKLSELTPSYLKKLPDDAFAASGPLQYKVTGQKYLLYSVGPDGKDDGGKPIDKPNQPGHSKSQLARTRYRIDTDSQGDIVAGINERG